MKLGILGLGSIAHAMALASKEVPGLTLYAVASRDLNKAILFQKTYHAQKAYGTYLELVSDPEVDLIYIATPHGYHHEHIKLCLDHNKHVLCEKAFTLNEGLARPMFEYARSKHLFIMEAMWTRFLPSTEKLIDVMKSKELGNIQEVNMSFGFKASYDKESRLFNPVLGGGALLDIGIYPLFMSYLLFGKTHKFQSKVSFSPSGVDIESEIILHYDTFDVHIHISLMKDLAPNRLEIKGDLDTLISQNFWMSASLEYVKSNKVYAYPFEYNGYAYELKACVEMIQLGKVEHPSWRHQDTLEILTWMDEIRRTWGLKYPIEMS